ncbi:hypothetical protein VTO42DRAFT_2196 [Malbranchea cinnamomea]
MSLDEGHRDKCTSRCSYGGLFNQTNLHQLSLCACDTTKNSGVLQVSGKGRGTLRYIGFRIKPLELKVLHTEKCTFSEHRPLPDLCCPCQQTVEHSTTFPRDKTGNFVKLHLSESSTCITSYALVIVLMNSAIDPSVRL